MTTVGSSGRNANHDAVHEFSDVDFNAQSLHHTLGPGRNQAAPGSVVGALVPIGGVIQYFGTTVPANWLLCDGSAFDGTVYPELATVLGATTVPDIRDRVPVGASGTKALNSTGGSDTSTVPAHDHGLSSLGWAKIFISAVAAPNLFMRRIATTPWTESIRGDVAPITTGTTERGFGAELGGATDTTGSVAINVQNKYRACHFIMRAK